MEIRQTVITDDEHGFEREVKLRVEVFVDDELFDAIEIGEGEPEDMTLSRDLRDAYKITSLISDIVRVVEKDGEPVHFSTRKVDKRTYYGF